MNTVGGLKCSAYLPCEMKHNEQFYVKIYIFQEKKQNFQREISPFDSLTLFNLITPQLLSPSAKPLNSCAIRTLYNQVTIRQPELKGEISYTQQTRCDPNIYNPTMKSLWLLINQSSK